MEPCVRWECKCLEGKEKFLGVVRPIEKHGESLFTALIPDHFADFKDLYDTSCSVFPRT